MFRRVALVSISALALTVAAKAADLDLPGPGGYKDSWMPMWSGLYAGFNAGYGWAADPHTVSVVNNVGASATAKELDPTGAFVGANLGYNWQRGNIVFGIEGDFEVSDIHDRYQQLFGANFFDARSNVDYFSTFRGRLGYAFGNVLVYGTGGFAYGAVHNRVFVNGVADAHKDDTETGWVGGAGVEYAISPQWSLKVEYQHIDLGSYTMSAPVVPPNGIIITTNRFDNTYDTVRAGLNYHLVAPQEPLK